MSKRDDMINRIVSIANKDYPDAEIFLYGSQARGDNKKLSDWDILILLNSRNFSFELETKLMDEFYELELETGEIISPLIYAKSDWVNKYLMTPFYENIQKEGIRLK